MSFRAAAQQRAEESPGSSGRVRAQTIRSVTASPFSTSLIVSSKHATDRIVAALRAGRRGGFLDTASAHARLTGSE
jgi:hypothetical protein